MICSLAAMGGAGYIWYQLLGGGAGSQQSQVATIEKKVSEVEAVGAGAKQAVDEIGNRVASAETKLAEGLSEVKQLVSTTESGLISQIGGAKQLLTQSETGLSEQIRSIRSVVETDLQGFRDEFTGLSADVLGVKSEIEGSLDDWALREAAHLLLIGNQRLQLAQDVKGARQALSLADQQLAKVTDSELHAVRKTLGDEIAALDSIAEIDLVTTSNTLTQLANKLDFLPIVGANGATAPIDLGNTTNAAEGGPDGSAVDKVLDIGRDFFADLGSTIRIESVDKPLGINLTLEVKQMIVTKGKLMLEGAQVALLRQQKEVYANRLSAAEDWANKYFQTENGQTEEWLEQLKELKQVDPAVELPDISASLKSLNTKLAAEG